jgi:lysylphosphatidylglycerol synthetase-like protein (DUF2156 family)
VNLKNISGRKEKHGEAIASRLNNESSKLGKLLRGGFPALIVYILVYDLSLLDIISQDFLTIYHSLLLFLSLIFLGVYSFYTEKLYLSKREMQISVMTGIFKVFFIIILAWLFLFLLTYISIKVSKKNDYFLSFDKIN